jgi:magnesium chelatase subunit I
MVTFSAPGTPAPPSHLPTTLGELRAQGYTPRSVKEEIRANLITRLAAGEPAFPGIVGFDDTVVPQVERALLAGHDFVLLGERGQGKTRLIRTIIGLLDEWLPIIAGSEINDDPMEPVSAYGKRQLAEQADDLRIDWIHRSERYGEKLATPDTSVGDLIGDVDPVKVAQGRTLGDPETVHFGMVPRTNRGIFAINELPDLAERIQVSLLNVLEERDIQVRGYTLRLPLDLLVVASANPEDYTNRGRIITPLKDRFGAEITTHYPLDVAHEVDLIAQESDLVAQVPRHLMEIVARFTRQVRESSAIDPRSGVSARFAVACTESLAGAALRRSAIVGDEAVARVGDLHGVVPTLRGKIEFEVSEEGREDEILEHLARRAVAEVYRSHLGGEDLSGLIARIDEGIVIESGDVVSAHALLESVGAFDGLARIVTAAEGSDVDITPGLSAACLELALEGLWLTRRIAKDESGQRVHYGSITRPEDD